MNFNFRTSLLALGAISIALVASAVMIRARNNQTQTTTVDLRTVSWTEAGGEPAALNQLDSSTVRDFIFQVIQTSGDSQTRDFYTAEGVSHFLIGDFKFVDMNHDGNLQLVTSIDVVGRPFFNWVGVIGKVNDQFRFDRVQSWGEKHDFGQEIRDLDGDGTLELLAKERWTDVDASTAGSIASLHDDSGRSLLPDSAWINVLQWNNGTLRNVSDRFNRFYQAEYMPTIQRALSMIDAVPDSDDIKQEIASVYKVNAFRALRTGGQRQTGYDEAVNWAYSKDPVLQTSAVQVFSDIGDSNSGIQLERLTRSNNPLISNRAAGVLDRLKIAR